MGRSGNLRVGARSEGGESKASKMASLAAHHQEQLANFLKFAAHKRAETLNEVDAAFSECIDTR